MQPIKHLIEKVENDWT